MKNVAIKLMYIHYIHRMSHCEKGRVVLRLFDRVKSCKKTCLVLALSAVY